MKGCVLFILAIFVLSTNGQLLSQANNPLLEGLGFGGKAALAVIKNLCGDEPPIACECQEENEEDGNELDDLDNVQVLTGPLPPCIPKNCICPDGSEQPLPSLPKRILKKVQKVLEKIQAKIASKLTKVCQNGETPTVCECENALMGELSFPVENEIDIPRCRPTRCSCPGQGPDGADEWVVIHPGRILMNQFINNMCAVDPENGPAAAIANFDSPTSQPLSCTCSNGTTEIEPPFNVRQMRYCQPEKCLCPSEDGGEPQEKDINLQNLQDRSKIFKRRFKKFNTLCPNDKAPVSCDCAGELGETISPPIDNPLVLLDCLPEICTCEDGSTVDIGLQKRKAFNRFAKICGDDMLPDSCECQDGSSFNPSEVSSEAFSDIEDSENPRKTLRKARRKVKKAFKKCKPISCNCPNGESKVVDFLGCKEGGFPSCFHENPELNKKNKLECSDGSKVKPLKAVLAQFKGKCVCEDNIMPKCPSGEDMKCPNGDLPDTTQVPELLSKCEQN